MSRVATASSRRVESSARRVLPFKTPVASITARTASKIRSGASERRSLGNWARLTAWPWRSPGGSRYGNLRRIRPRSEIVRRSPVPLQFWTDEVANDGSRLVRLRGVVGWRLMSTLLS